MKSRYLAIALMLILLALMPAMGSAQVPQNGLMKVGGVSWYGVNSTDLVAPGDNYAPLYVTFYNAFGTVTNLSVSIGLNGSTVFSYSHISGSSSMVTENIGFSAAGSSYVIVQPMNISGKARPGIYTLQLHYTFLVNATAFDGNSSITVPVLGNINIVGTQSYFGSQSSPLAATPGMKNIPLTVVLENTGNSPVSNISIHYVPTGPLSGQVQETYVSAVQAFGYATVTFTVSVRTGYSDGIYSQNLTSTYGGIQSTVQFEAAITGYSNISLVTYYTNPPVIYESMKFIQLTAVFVNSGNSFAPNLNITASSSSFGILTNGYMIPYLGSGDLFNATFLLNAPSQSGSFSVAVNTGHTSYNMKFNVKSNGSIRVSQSVPAMTPGQSKAVEAFTLTNSGNSSIYDLNVYLVTPSIISVHVSSSNPLSGLTASNFTIGQLNPGQSFTVTFVVDVSSSAPSGGYQSQLFMTYMMNDSQMKFTHVYNFENTVQPTAVQSFENFLTFSIAEFVVLIVIIVIIFSVVGFAVRSRRKKGKK